MLARFQPARVGLLLCLSLSVSGEPREVRVNLDRPAQLRYRLDQEGSDWVSLAAAAQGSQDIELPAEQVILQAWSDHGFWHYSAERRVLASSLYVDLHMSKEWNGLRIAGILGGISLAALLGLAWRSRNQSARLQALQSLDVEEGDAWIGRSVGSFRILQRLGRGGMGVVYLGADAQNEKVAIKIFAEEDGDPLALERFRRECVMAGRLSHPNLVRVVDFGELGKTHYLALEYIQGTTLRKRMSRDGLEVKQAISWFLAITEGLNYCHQNQVLHCDLKPENIMVSNSGNIKILDFGLARDQNARQLTPLDSLVGTPCYLAPERFLQSTRVPTPAVDQYALGVLFYEMLAGRPPYYSEDLAAYASLHRKMELPSLQTFRPDLDTWLIEVIQRMLEKEPQARFPSLREVLIALRDGPSSDSDTTALY